LLIHVILRSHGLSQVAVVDSLHSPVDKMIHYSDIFLFGFFRCTSLAVKRFSINRRTMPSANRTPVFSKIQKMARVVLGFDVAKTLGTKSPSGRHGE
jgi:hypothetical protein